MIPLSHLLVAYVVLVQPWLGYRLFNKLKANLALGIAGAKLRFYQRIVIHQIAATAMVFIIWRLGSIPGKDLGLCLPTSWQILLPFLIGFVLAMTGVTLLLRKQGGNKLKKSLKVLGVLLPFSSAERSWFAAVSVGAGISEELVFRGFLFYYLTINIPALGIWQKIALASFLFGMCHIYQGWKGVMGTTILGAAFACLYAGSRSLLLPMIVHALFDLRLLLIFTPKRLQELQAEDADPERQSATL